MLFHISSIALVCVVVWLFHRYQLVSDHLLPALRRHGILGQTGYTQLSTFDQQAAAGVSRPCYTACCWSLLCVC